MREMTLYTGSAREPLQRRSVVSPFLNAGHIPDLQSREKREKVKRSSMDKATAVERARFILQTSGSLFSNSSLSSSLLSPLLPSPLLLSSPLKDSLYI